MKHSLRTKLSSAIALVVLITVALISFLSNVLIENQFKNYITRQQEFKTTEIVNSLTQKFGVLENGWNIDYIHTIGMFALYEGYIVKVYDKQNNVIWDARAHDMSLCTQTMQEITRRMEKRYPQMEGGFKSKIYHLTSENEQIGAVSISYYGPFFLSENDFKFLNALNTVLIAIGLISLAFSVIVGFFVAKRLSRPILQTVDAAKQIADGNYAVQVGENSDTKELNLLISSINHLSSTLNKQEKLRKQLTGDVAHELRTPLAILQSHIEAMLEGVWQPTNERLQSCYEETSRIVKLVSDLENLAKFDAELTLNKTEVDLSHLISKALSNFEVELKNKNIEVFTSGEASRIFADTDRIFQVLINLLSNAVKYSNDSGRIEISISETKNTVSIALKDSGIGIPADELPYIFERFYRADKSRNRLTGGSGIGLAIVKSIVDAHGGKVTAESIIGQGSCFAIVLPKK